MYIIVYPVITCSWENSMEFWCDFKLTFLYPGYGEGHMVWLIPSNRPINPIGHKSLLSEISFI